MGCMLSNAPPLKEKAEHGELAVKMKRWGILAMCWLRRYWVTAWCLALLLLFPKLIAAVVAMTIRLTTRLVVALVMRVFREVAVELGRVLTQLSSLTSGLEKALVQYLDSMMVELLPTSLLVLPGPGGEQGPGEEILARSGQSAGLGDNPPQPSQPISDSPTSRHQSGGFASAPSPRWGGQSSMSLSLLFLPLKDQDSPDLYYYARRLRAKSYFDWHRLGEIFNCSQPIKMQ